MHEDLCPNARPRFLSLSLIRTWGGYRREGLSIKEARISWATVPDEHIPAKELLLSACWSTAGIIVCWLGLSEDATLRRGGQVHFFHVVHAQELPQTVTCCVTLLRLPRPDRVSAAGNQGCALNGNLKI